MLRLLFRPLSIALKDPLAVIFLLVVWEFLREQDRKREWERYSASLQMQSAPRSAR